MTTKGLREQLSAPFPESSVEWRIGRSGIDGSGRPWAMALCYLTARAVMDRLDDVFGPEHWGTTFDAVTCGRESGFLCRLTCTWDNLVVSKSDGAPGSQIEPLKGGISGALKRAAVQWGIGRYLYDLDETYVETSLEKRPGWVRAQAKGRGEQKVTFWWKPPQLPSWALPGGSGVPPEKAGPRLPVSEPHDEPTEDDLEAVLKLAATLDQKIRDAKAIKHLANIAKKYKPDMDRISAVHPEAAEGLRKTFKETQLRLAGEQE